MLIVLQAPGLAVLGVTVLQERLLAEPHPDAVTVGQLVHDGQGALHRDHTNLLRLEAGVKPPSETSTWPRYKLPQSIDLALTGFSSLVLTWWHLAEWRIEDLHPVGRGQLAAVHHDAELLPAHVALRAAWSMGMAFMLCMLAEAL